MEAGNSAWSASELVHPPPPPLQPVAQASMDRGTGVQPSSYIMKVPSMLGKNWRNHQSLQKPVDRMVGREGAQEQSISSILFRNRRVGGTHLSHIQELAEEDLEVLAKWRTV